MLDPRNTLLSAIATPALVVDVTALDANIKGMAGTASANGTILRPHVKTHKSVDIVKRQLAAGAIGISCATIWECEHFAKNGIADILLTAPIASSDKASRLAQLNPASEISAVVDHENQITLISKAAQSKNRRIRILIDTDVGQLRTGIVDIAHGLELARLIEAAPNLIFSGIQGFAGQAQHILDGQQRKQAAQSVADRLIEFRSELRKAGHDVNCITGSGTGTSFHDVSGPYTELQVGSYVFMDADYGKLVGEGHPSATYQTSLYILATVVSANRPGQVTVDAGTKALAVNGPLPAKILGAPAGTTYRFAGDEHGILELPASTIAPTVGSKVLIEASHCDPTVNLHSAYYALDGERLDLWSIGARYGTI